MDCELFKYLWRLGKAESHRELGEAFTSLRSHEASCQSCNAWVSRELALDQHLSREMAKVEVPVDLGQRLRRRLSSPITEPVSVRARPFGGWNRKWTALVAAMVLIIGTGTLLILPHPKPVTDDSWNLFWDDCFAWEVSPPDRDRVAAWFSTMGIRTELPMDVNYQHLVSHGLVVWDGRMVPQLVFANPSSTGGRPAIAKVLVLSSKQFQLDSLFPCQGLRKEREVGLIFFQNPMKNLSTSSPMPGRNSIGSSNPRYPQQTRNPDEAPEAPWGRLGVCWSSSLVGLGFCQKCG